MRSQPWVWQDVFRAATFFEFFLFTALPVCVVLLRPSIKLNREALLKINFAFAALTVLDWSRIAWPLESFPIPALGAVAAAAVLAFVFSIRTFWTVKWQRWSLPLLIVAALWCIIAVPIKQNRHERRERGRLTSVPPGAKNVLLIIVDTLRADHLSIYGYDRPTDPNLAQIAKQGVVFDNTIAPSSWTLPSHASMLTGLLPHQHHVDGSASNMGFDYPTLAEAFHNQGYRTAAFSANTFLFNRRRAFGRGFLHFEYDFQSWGSDFAQTYYGSLIEKLLDHLRLKRDLMGRLSAADINRHALRWIEADQKPFFVVINYYDVHDPYLPPEPYIHRYTDVKNPGGRVSDAWSWFEHLTPAQVQAAMDAYDGAINYVDVELAALISDLKAHHLTDNTLVVITSDHGESFNEHGFMNHGNALYRELIHVPLILWQPGRVPAGRRVTDPVDLVDLPATLSTMANLRGPQRFPGLVLSCYWDGSYPCDRNEPAVSELAQLLWNPKFPNYYREMLSATDAQYHYISGGKPGVELFPCCSNQPEAKNLAETGTGKAVIQQFAIKLQMSFHLRNEEARRANVLTTDGHSLSNPDPLAKGRGSKENN